MLLTVLGLFGCGGSTDKRAAEKIEEALQAKYGEEFVVEGLGGGYSTMSNNRLKAVVYPKNAPNTRVNVQITKDLKQVYDDYVNIKVAQAAKGPIEHIVKALWPDGKVSITNDAGLNDADDKDTSMSYEEFVKLHPENWQLVYVFLNSADYMDAQGRMNQEAEIQKFDRLARQLSASKYLRSSIGVYYLTPEAYSLFEEAERSKTSVLNYYDDLKEKDGKVSLVTGITYDLADNGGPSKDKAAFDEQFELWKNVREAIK
ncbi:hypothetical protein [Paenibacillus aurantiacus]